MDKLTCFIFGHKEETHLDYIYGSLPREHRICLRCRKGLFFQRPTEDRENELVKLGDIRDGDVRGCKVL